jgi:ribulose-5-phosphate 4-epimerase/fuculose-1-phosphate aldolase
MLETISEIFQEAYKRNWITARDGNASIRWRDRDHMYVTPSGIRKQTLQPEMFIKWDIASHCALPYTDLSASLRPSGELPLHWGLQRKIDTEVRVVLHLHPTYTVAAMYAGIELSTLVKEFPELGRYTRVGKNVPDVPPISQALADASISELGLRTDGSVYNHIVGIDRHGIVAVDTSPWRAFEHAERMEHIAKIVMTGRK